MQTKSKQIQILLVACIGLFSSCQDMFEFSPFVAEVEESQLGSTQKNLAEIAGQQNGSEAFKFAFVTDSHYHYDNLGKVVRDINQRGDLAFTIFGGDITHQGTLKEYELFYQLAENLAKPYLTIIGNHDYKANGGAVYQQMFGPFNYSFAYENYKLVLFDDVVWESNKNPDFGWLNHELSDHQNYDHVLVLAHLAPFADQFTIAMEQTYTALMRQNQVPLSIHGHGHVYTYTDRYKDDVNYMIGPWLKTPSYCIIHVNKNQVQVELVEL